MPLHRSRKRMVPERRIQRYILANADMSCSSLELAVVSVVSQSYSQDHRDPHEELVVNSGFKWDNAQCHPWRFSEVFHSDLCDLCN